MQRNSGDKLTGDCFKVLTKEIEGKNKVRFMQTKIGDKLKEEFQKELTEGKEIKFSEEVYKIEQRDEKLIVQIEDTV